MSSFPTSVDLGDFDALSVMTDLIIELRSRSITSGQAAIVIDAPSGWHRLTLTVSATGHGLARIVSDDLTTSRRHNVTRALLGNGWTEDEGRESMYLRLVPGTQAGELAFDLLAALGAGGAPSGIRALTVSTQAQLDT